MKERWMTAVMIAVDPHKGSHTAVAIDGTEEPLGEARGRASAARGERPRPGGPGSRAGAERLVPWAAGWPGRTWGVEGAWGLGRLLARQLVAGPLRVFRTA